MPTGTCMNLRPLLVGTPWLKQQGRKKREGKLTVPLEAFQPNHYIKVESSKNLSEIFIEQVYIVSLCISQIGFGSMIEKVGLNLWSEPGLHNIAPSSSDNQLG